MGLACFPKRFGNGCMQIYKPQDFLIKDKENI